MSSALFPITVIDVTHTTTHTYIPIHKGEKASEKLRRINERKIRLNMVNVLLQKEPLKRKDFSVTS